MVSCTELGVNMISFTLIAITMLQLTLIMLSGRVFSKDYNVMMYKLPPIVFIDPVIYLPVTNLLRNEVKLYELTCMYYDKISEVSIL